MLLLLTCHLVHQRTRNSHGQSICDEEQRLDGHWSGQRVGAVQSPWQMTREVAGSTPVPSMEDCRCCILKRLQLPMWVGFALVEAIALYALVVALILLFVF